MAWLARKTRMFLWSVRHRGLFRALLFEARALVFAFRRDVLGRRTVTGKVMGLPMVLSLEVRGISRELFIYGDREADHRFFFETEIAAGDRVLDIGANIGYYALMEAVLAGPEGRVMAVEPDPRNLPLLRENIRRNGLAGRIEVFETALSNWTGTGAFALHRLSNLSALAPRHQAAEAGEEYERLLEVAVTDVREFLAVRGGAELLRMDIEGREAEILEGVAGLLDGDRSLVPAKMVFEAHPETYGDGAMGKHLDRLLGFYRVKWLSTFNAEATEAMVRDGRRPERVVATDFEVRGIFRDVPADEALAAICDQGRARIVCLARDEG